MDHSTTATKAGRPMVLVTPGSAAAHDMFLDAYGERVYELFALLKTELEPHGMMDLSNFKTSSAPTYHTFVDTILKSIVMKPTLVPRLDW